MGIGAVGTWATALGFISIAGTNAEDGQVVLGVAVLGLLALWARTRRDALWPAIVALLCGAVGAAITGIDLHKLSEIGTSEFFGREVHLVHPGWGIYLALGASTALFLLALAVMIVGPDDADAERRSGLPADHDDGDERHYSAGIAFVVLLIAVGTVVAVSHIGTSTSASANQTARSSAAAATQTGEAPSSSSETSASTATQSSTAPATSEPLEALERYWADIGSQNYNGAYTYLAAGAAGGLSESEFVSSERRAGIQHVEFRGQVGASSSSTATIEVVSLVTHDQQFGCRVWSGSYEMTDQSGSWEIEKASLTPRSCG